MRRGDHLVSVRAGYTHHGIYIGCGEVLHYSGFGDSVSGPICRVSVDRFSGGMPTTVMPHPLAVYDAEERIARGYTRLGEDSYNLVTNNCEHFVSWCIYGVNTSQQVRGVFGLAGIAAKHAGSGAVGGVLSVMGAGVVARNLFEAASEADEPAEAVLKVAGKEAIGKAAAIGAAAVIGGPVGLVGAAAVFAAKKLFFK